MGGEVEELLLGLGCLKTQYRHLVTVKSQVRNLTNCQSLKIYRCTFEQLVVVSEF